MEQEIQQIKELAERNYEMIQDNTAKINNNLEKINENKYGLEILRDYKREAQRWFIAFGVASILLVITFICLLTKI